MVSRSRNIMCEIVNFHAATRATPIVNVKHRFSVSWWLKLGLGLMTRSDVNYTIFRESICRPLEMWHCLLNSTAVIPSEGTTCLLSGLDLNDSNIVARIAQIWPFHGYANITLHWSDWKGPTYENSMVEELIRKIVHVYCQCIVCTLFYSYTIIYSEQSI